MFANDPDLFDSKFRFDTGIALEQACGAKILHNTVFSTRTPNSSSIKWRFPYTAASIANNLVSHDLKPRDSGAATLAGNVTHAAAGLFVSAATGDLHLRPTASAAMNQAAAISTPVPWDIDGQPRGAPADVGADEYSAAAELLPPSGLTVASLVGNTVTLSWAAPNGGVTPTGYVVEGGASPGAVLASLPTGGVTPTISFVAPSGISYVPRARDGRGHEKRSLERSAAARERDSAARCANWPAGTGQRRSTVTELAERHGGKRRHRHNDRCDRCGERLVPSAVVGQFFVRGRASRHLRVCRARLQRIWQQRTVQYGHSDVSGSCAAPQTPVNFSATHAGNVISVSWAPALNGAAPTGYILIVRGTYNHEVPIAGRSISAPVGPGTYTLSVASTNPCGTSTPTAAQTVTLWWDLNRRSPAQLVYSTATVHDDGGTRSVERRGQYQEAQRRRVRARPAQAAEAHHRVPRLLRPRPRAERRT